MSQINSWHSCEQVSILPSYNKGNQVDGVKDPLRIRSTRAKRTVTFGRFGKTVNSFRGTPVAEFIRLLFEENMSANLV